MTAEQYGRFVEMVRRVLDELQVPGDREPSPIGVLKINTREGGTIEAGLHNLAQIAAGKPDGDWTNLCREHFSALIQPDQKPSDSKTALASLRVRLWPIDYLEQAKAPIYREVAPGLTLVLVLDLLRSIMGLQNQDLLEWGISHAAEENTSKEPVELVQQAGPKGATIMFLVGDHLYVSSHALWLDRHLKLNPDRGALVGVPIRHLVAAHAIEELNVVQVVGIMIGSNRRIYAEGPGSISPELYWWRRGTFVHIPTAEHDGKRSITPPDSFVELLNSLPAPS
jgi:hypothetical protein